MKMYTRSDFFCFVLKIVEICVFFVVYFVLFSEMNHQLHIKYRAMVSIYSLGVLKCPNIERYMSSNNIFRNFQLLLLKV